VTAPGEGAGDDATIERQHGVGVPDGWQRIWMPERMAYLRGEGKDDGCPFCSIPSRSDEEGLIIRRGRLCFAVLNLYPYNSGHLMVVPFRHVASYLDLSDEETDEFGGMTKQAIQALQRAAGPQGFNIGMNQGRVAGAGIAEHLHQHVVPRWGGDANFFPIVARTKVLPQLLSDTRQMLADAWPA
jgi:ATP adenylyltransferase